LPRGLSGSHNRPLIVIGAGPAGLLAAGQAAAAPERAGAGTQVLLLEKMARPGRKLRLAGGGRGNLTNTAPLDDFLAQFGANGPFLRAAFAGFFAPELRAFLAELGVPTVVEPSGQVYPASNRAADVVDALVRWVQAQGVTLRTRTPVVELLVERGRIAGVRAADGTIHPAVAVVLAAGGTSYPATGSRGDGCRLAAAAGHMIVPLRPALVPLETAGDVALRLQGLALRGVAVHLYAGGKKRATQTGDLLLTHFGVSGPAVLALSRTAVDALRAGQEVGLALDLFPDLEGRALDERLRRVLEAHGKQQAATVLAGLLPRRLVPIALAEASIAPGTHASQISAAARRRLRAWLQDWRLEVVGPRPWSEAQVTAGGVDLREVDPQTMASRRVHGLYLAGEVLDLDAGTGGYNLQAAFSTGWLAGRSAGRTPRL
jgi:predicted Rossmann fold flavoprotein